MNRQQAVQWCVDNIIEWPEFKPSIAPDSWYWTECFGQWVLDAGETSVPISKQSWLFVRNITNVVNCQCTIVPVTRRINHDDTIPCGQSFSDLMKELNNA